MPGTEHVPPPDEYRCIFECRGRGGCDMMCARYVEYVLEKEGDIAAVIAEPIRSTPYIPKPEYWQIIRKACDRHGALLIFDEIPHSLGRTGRMFTCENFEVVPDMLVIGKGLGGGVLPLAALIVRADLDVAAERALGHYTHEKNPVPAPRPWRRSSTSRTHSLVAHARDLGRYSLDRLKEMKERHPLIGDVRGLGLFLGIELVKDRQTRERASDEAEAVMYAALSARPELQDHHGQHPHAHPAAHHHPGGDGPGPRDHRAMHRRRRKRGMKYTPLFYAYARIFSPLGSTNGRSATCALILSPKISTSSAVPALASSGGR